VRGHVTAAHPSGPTAAGAEGRAALGILLDAVDYRGKTVLLSTELIGGGAGLSTILEGKGGGGKSAGAGQIEIPADTMFFFRLKEPVTLLP
jgi:hypothetical protein